MGEKYGCQGGGEGLKVATTSDILIFDYSSENFETW